MRTSAPTSSRSALPKGPSNALSLPPAYWSQAPEQLFTALATTPDGLAPAEAQQRLKQFGLNTIRAQSQTTALRVRLSQFKMLFALALAVGHTPELLPAIISITLSYGAQQMARRGVIVRRLAAVENFGSMDVLCTDKTGTLTAAVLRYAYLNAHHQTGLSNPHSVLSRCRRR